MMNFMATKEKLKVTFLGTGTSQGVPVIACECPVCQSKDDKDKRLRSSVLIEKGNTKIVIDTGPDFRYQMLRAKVKRLDAILFTHAHKDHTAGMDDIRSFNYLQRSAMPVYCEEQVLNSLHNEFAYVFDDDKYPGIPEIESHIIVPNKIYKVGDIEFQTIRIMHAQLPIIAFRIDNFAYITDANYIDPTSLNYLQGLDVLVINALRIKHHISHFNLQEALEVIEKLKPKNAYLTHISHLMGFHQEVSKELPPHVKLTYDMLEVTV